MSPSPFQSPAPAGASPVAANCRPGRRGRRGQPGLLLFSLLYPDSSFCGIVKQPSFLSSTPTHRRWRNLESRKSLAHLGREIKNQQFLWGALGGSAVSQVPLYTQVLLTYCIVLRRPVFHGISPFEQASRSFFWYAILCTVLRIEAPGVLASTRSVSICHDLPSLQHFTTRTRRPAEQQPSLYLICLDLFIACLVSRLLFSLIPSRSRRLPRYLEYIVLSVRPVSLATPWLHPHRVNTTPDLTAAEIRTSCHPVPRGPLPLGKPGAEPSIFKYTPRTLQRHFRRVVQVTLRPQSRGGNLESNFFHPISVHAPSELSWDHASALRLPPGAKRIANSERMRKERGGVAMRRREAKHPTKHCLLPPATIETRECAPDESSAPESGGGGGLFVAPRSCRQEADRQHCSI